MYQALIFYVAHAKSLGTRLDYGMHATIGRTTPLKVLWCQESPSSGQAFRPSPINGVFYLVYCVLSQVFYLGCALELFLEWNLPFRFSQQLILLKVAGNHVNEIHDFCKQLHFSRLGWLCRRRFALRFACLPIYRYRAWKVLGTYC